MSISKYTVSDPETWGCLEGPSHLTHRRVSAAPEPAAPLLWVPSLGFEHVVQDTRIKLHYSNAITKYITQRAGHAEGNSAKDVRLSQDPQSSHHEHGPEVDPEGLHGVGKHGIVTQM